MECGGAPAGAAGVRLQAGGRRRGGCPGPACRRPPASPGQTTGADLSAVGLNIIPKLISIRNTLVDIEPGLVNIQVRETRGRERGLGVPAPGSAPRTLATPRSPPLPIPSAPTHLPQLHRTVGAAARVFGAARVALCVEGAGGQRARPRRRPRRPVTHPLPPPVRFWRHWRQHPAPGRQRPAPGAGLAGVARARRARAHARRSPSPPRCLRASPSPPSATTTSRRAWWSTPFARWAEGGRAGGAALPARPARARAAHRRRSPFPSPQIIAPTHVSYTPKKETQGGVGIDLSDAEGQATAAALAAEGWGAKKG